MKRLTIICFAAFAFGVLAFLAQIWFHLWSEGTFIKLLVTDIGLFAIIFVWAFLVKENKESQRLHRDNKLDE